MCAKKSDPKEGQQKAKLEDVQSVIESMVERGVASLPAVDVAPVVENPESGDEEAMVVMISDLQIGHLTPTTSALIIRNRMRRFAERVVRLANIHRQAYPIKRLYVFLLGDCVQHELVGRFVSLQELECTLMPQMFKWAIPMLEEALLTWCTQFEQVDVYTVNGNHGGFGKFQSEDFNLDAIIYKFLESHLADQPNLTFHVELEHFWQKVSILRKNFLLVHGDQINMWQNLPWYGITQKAMRWQGSLPGHPFKYMVLGHFHVASCFDWNDVEIFVNGCFVSDDQWVLKKLGMASSTTQWAFGVHPRKGVTWRYKIRLD